MTPIGKLARLLTLFAFAALAFACSSEAPKEPPVGQVSAAIVLPGVPYLRQRDYYPIGESACEATSTAMLLRYFYPSSQIDVPEIYHAGMQMYDYQGPVLGYQNVSFASGYTTDPGLSVVPPGFSGYYSTHGSNSSGRGNQAVRDYLDHVWGIATTVLSTEDQLYTALASGPVLGHVWGHGNTAWGHYIVILAIDDRGTPSRSDDIVYAHDPYDRWGGWDPNGGENRPITHDQFFLGPSLKGGAWFRDAVQLTPADTQTQREYTVVVDSGHNAVGGNTAHHVLQLDDPGDLVDGTSTYTWTQYYGALGDWVYPGEAGHIARFTPQLTMAGSYQVSIKYHADATNGAVTWGVYDSGGSQLASVVVDQHAAVPGWQWNVISPAVNLSNGAYVRATDISAGSNIDAVKFKYLGPTSGGGGGTGACATPMVSLPPVGGTFSGTTSGASTIGGATCGDGSGGAPERAYTWTPSTSGTATISTCGSSFDTVLYVRTGSCEGGTEVACSDDACGRGSQVTLSVVAGTKYYLFVDGYGSYSGSYTLDITPPSGSAPPPPPPLAGACASATTVPASGGTFSGSTSGASEIGGATCGLGGGGAPERVYAWTPSVSGAATVSTCGSSYDTVLYMRSGDCASGYEIACSDDSSCGLASQISTNVVAGTTYYVFVDGYGANAGPYTLNVTAPSGGPPPPPPPPPTPPAGACGSATTLPASGGTFSGTTSGASATAAGTCGGEAPERVFAWTPSATGTATVSTCGSSFDTVLYMRSGDCSPGTELACSDDACAGGGSQISVPVVAGTTYYVFVDGYVSSAGSYTLNVTPPAGGGGGTDACLSATPLPASGGTFSGVTAGTSGAGGASCGNGGNNAPERVYAWTPSTSGTATVSTCGSGFDTVLYVRGGVCASGPEVACNDDNAACGNGSRVTFSAVAGTTYYLFVDGYGASNGGYTLSVSGP